MRPRIGFGGSAARLFGLTRHGFDWDPSITDSVSTVIPAEFREFFVASAGATGALVGLLFVAVSVLPDLAQQAGSRVEFRSRSSAALLVFTNALIISLAALVPGVSLGWWAIACGVVVLAFAAATARSALSASGRAGGWLWLLVGLVIIGGVEIWTGARLIDRIDPDALEWLCYVVIADLGFGIARAWQLLGLRDSGLTASLRILFGRRPLENELGSPTTDRAAPPTT